MEALIRKIREYLQEKNRARKLRNTILSVAVVVVFVTTYALILPAITLDQDTAATDPAVVLEENQQEKPDAANADTEETEKEAATSAETPAEAPVETEAPAEAEAPVETEAPAAAAAKTSAETEAPAETEAEVLAENTKATSDATVVPNAVDTAETVTVSEEPQAGEQTFKGRDFTLTVKYDESAGLTASARLMVTELIAEERDNPEDYDYVNKEYYDGYKDGTLFAIRKKVDTLTELSDVRFFNIHFTQDGQAITPAGTVTVTIKYEKPVEIDSNVTIKAVHFDASKETPVVLPVEVSGKKGQGDENDTVEKISFETSRLSFYAITFVALKDEAVMAEETETENEKTIFFMEEEYSTAEVNMPAVKFVDLATNVIVNVEAEEGTFPEGTTMKVTSVDAGEVEAAAENVIDGKIQKVEAVDITFCNAEGEEIQPAKPIRVTMLPKSIKHAEDATVVHVDGEGNADVVEAQAEGAKLQFEAEKFSVYAIVYTVDFHWDVDGKTYDFSIPGGGFLSLEHLVKVLGIATAEENGSDTAKSFVADVASVEFSSPELVWVGNIDEATTIGALKEANSLDVQYSAELTVAQIAEIDAQKVGAGDWALISLQPFTSEESLTITMKNGDQFVVRVTDAQAISDAEKATIDPNKSYLICYQVGDTYYLLKNDGSVDSDHHPDFEGDPDAAHNFEHLNSTYAWTFNHIFKEQDVEHHLDKNYYLIRPIDDKAKTLALNHETSAANPLVQQGNNNTAVVQSEGGFILEGYHNIGTEDNHRYLHLGFDGSHFIAVDGDGVTIHIYEMDNLPTYDYTVRSADENWGTVTVSDGAQQDVTEGGEVVAHYYAATSDANKMNNGMITATPNNHKNNELRPGQEGYGQNKWLFDHWDQDGLPLDRAEFPATIDANTLPIPFNGSNLTAYFRQNPYYVVPDGEKEPTSIDNMSQWLAELQNRDIPLETASTKKSAEVYDYTNRIYRVDLAAKANFQTFSGSVDMAFCMDVSASMKFPSKLVTAETNYNRNTNPIPIYQINGTGHKTWLDTSRTYSNPYYLIADEEGTATVFKIYYEGGNWRAQDASRDQGVKTFKIGDQFETAWAGNTKYPFNAGDNNNTTYTIYNNGDPGRDRFYYLQESFKGGSGELNTIAGLLNVAGDESPNVRIAYNSFNGSLATGAAYWEDFAPASAIDVTFRSASNGGTRPDLAFEDLENTRKYHWTADAGNRYVVLITDGAPQSGGLPKIAEATRAAAHIKEALGVKIITVGLSMEDVTEGKKLLYDIADKDKNGDKMFYLAESGDDLQGIIRKITKTIMEDVVVIGDITDTVGEAFYLVDKDTGMPLRQGDMIDIEGNRVTDNRQAAGIVQADGKTVKWINQSIDHTNGWHGALYVKAQEEMLGGNAVNTNAGNATVVATKYRTGGTEIYFDTTSVKDHLKLSTSLPSPKVNVNELTFFDNETAWTVYLGEEVDPKQQLKALYNSLVVEKVVNEDGSLHYTLGRNTIDERWDAAVGTVATFSLPDLIENLIRKDSILKARYLINNELNWNAFLTDILNGGITLPYHEFGLTDGSNLKITLEKTIAANEEDNLITRSPHNTTVTGDEVEKYVLRIAYEPDYTVTPIGQGGQNTEDFHTGTYGTMYQGHAAGREASINTHIINVYNVPLDVYKTDEDHQPLAGAVFKLYKADDENGENIPALDGSHKYVEVAAATSGADGIARLKHGSEDFGLVRGEKYYLIEAAAPEKYAKVNTVWEVEVQTELGKFTDLTGKMIYSSLHPDSTATPPVVVGTGVMDIMYPFYWDQGARIMLDGKDPLAVITKGETEGTTAEITDGSFVSHETAISFRHTVVNLIDGELNISVNKAWDDNDDPNRPSSVTMKLYRVSEKDHVWGSGTVVPSTCTSTGNKEYTCSICGEKTTEVISAAGHSPGTAHHDNQTEATCTTAGGYDHVIRCTVCNAIITSEHISIDALGHIAGETVQENYVAPTYTADGGYDDVVYCTRCGGEISRTHVTLPRLASPNHTVTVTFKYIANDLLWTTYEETITSRTGTGAGDMTIQWNWSRTTSPQFVTLRVNGLGTSSYSTSSSGNYYGAQQTLTISNISEDLNVTVIIDNWGYAGTNDSLIGQPVFAGLSARALQASAPSLNNEAAALNESASHGTDGSLQVNESGSMTQEAVTAYLNRIGEMEAATCANTEGASHTYKEEVGTYTITSGEHWTKDISGLPQYNEYGKPYTYYVVETAVTGYEITYSGQDNGIQNEDGSITIHNKKTKGSLLITKNVTYNGREAATDEEKALLNGSYTFAVRKNGTEIAGSPYTITVTNGVSGSVLIENLDAGSDYTIEETSSGALVLKNVTGGTAVNNNIVTASVTAGKQTEADLPDTAKAVFTNNYAAYEVVIVKVDTCNTETRLGGAEFELYAKESVEDGQIRDGAEPIRTNLVSASSGEDKGKVSLGSLVPGEYYLLETKAPEGYIIMDMPVKINVTEDRVNLLQGTRQETGTITQEKATVSVMNSAGVALPNTGGMGTYPLYILGVMLIGLAGTGLVMMQRRKYTA